MIVSSKYDGYPVYSPNGERIAFASIRSGDWQIWVCDKDGSKPIQLTNVKGGEAWPTSWQPADGRQIGFISNSDGIRRAYMVAATGGIPERVPELSTVTSPIDSFWWSPNGSWIVYSTMDEVWKTPTRGGRPIRIGVGGGQPTFDGAGVITTTEGPGMRSLDIVPLDGEASRPSGLSRSSARPVDSVALTLSGILAYSPSGVYVASNSSPSIPNALIFFPLLKGSVSGSVRQLSSAAAGFGMSLSPNGHSLLYTKFVSAGADLVLVDRFK